MRCIGLLLIFAIGFLSSCDERKLPSSAAKSPQLICMSVDGTNANDHQSCDDLCAAKEAVCTGYESVVHPFGCATPVYDTTICRCCRVGR